MKHSYKYADENSWQIVYTMSRRYPATETDPAGGGEIEIEEIWMMGISPNGSERRVLDINSHLRGDGDLKAIFGKYIYETLAEHAADDVADERAAFAEYSAEARKE